MADVLFVPGRRVQRTYRTYKTRLSQVIRMVLEELERMGNVEARRRWLLEHVSISRTSKLGTIVSFSLPAMVTCPGMSGYCEEWCYAMKGRYAIQPVMRTRIVNMLASLLPGFPEALAEKLPRSARILQLHDSGDIYSVSWLLRGLESLGIDPRLVDRLLGVELEKLPDDYYVRQLAKLADILAERGVRIYMYTRSWRVPRLWESIVKLLVPKKNVVIYLSVDPSMKREEIRRAEEIARRYPNVQIAYTGMMGPGVVCPSIKTGGKVTCAQCLYCPLGRGNVVFPTH